MFCIISICMQNNSLFSTKIAYSNWLKPAPQSHRKYGIVKKVPWYHDLEFMEYFRHDIHKWKSETVSGFTDSLIDLNVLIII